MSFHNPESQDAAARQIARPMPYNAQVRALRWSRRTGKLLQVSPVLASNRLGRVSGQRALVVEL
jgi:hypothetical protein